MNSQVPETNSTPQWTDPIKQSTFKLEGWEFRCSIEGTAVSARHECGVEYGAYIKANDEREGTYLWYSILQHVC